MKRIKYLIIMSFLSTLFGFGQTDYKNENAKAFAETIQKKGVQVVDVRTGEEYVRGHLKGAVLMDYYTAGFEEKAIKLLNKEQPVAVYCRSGKRSASAAALLAKKGFQVINLEGGIIAWEEQKLPLER